jgi:HTH-type transcriptional regulator / antitoxin HigA
MIANDRQYQQTRKKAGELDLLLDAVRDGSAGDDGFRDLQDEALLGQLDDLRGEIAEYDDLRSGMTTRFESTTLAGLAEALIKARIARGWTQSDLAAALGVAEQQVQRYEASRYTGASLARLGDIATALNATVTETVVLIAG